ncbi:MAG: hypothetical protein JRI25_25935, partial [Deltaproteobacteria bacterium]|nr:hypothetical protein [Deltaproteobacteria bacterium]
MTTGIRRWVAAAPVLLVMLSIGTARAQGLDASGPAVMPGDGDPARPVRVAAPWNRPTGNLAAGVHLAYTSNPLVQFVEDGGEVVSDPLIRHALGARLSVGWAAHSRISLAADLPVRWNLAGREHALGPALGDASLWASFDVVDSHHGFALAVAPYLQVPTGARDKYTGAGTVRGGGLATARVRGTWWSFTAEMGLGSEPAVPSLELSGGAAGRAGVAATWLPRPEVGLGVEARAWMPLSAPMRAERGTPAEVLATVRARHPGGAWILGGASRSLANGVGMGSWSGFIGVGGTFGASPQDRVREPTILVVTDPDGHPVRGATLSSQDTVLGTTDAWGRSRLDPSSPARTLSLSAPGLQTTAVTPPKTGELMVTLPWAPVPLEIRVVDQTGSPVDAQVVIQ